MCWRQQIVNLLVFHETRFLQETFDNFMCMRKKWTAKTDVSDSDLDFREKRKWQIALRRYVLLGQKSSAYAPFFGIDSRSFRQWVELQFEGDCNWDNFSDNWQLDHIVPVGYFDFKDQEDMKLCWNFVNIRVEPSGANKNSSTGIDVLAAKAYFLEMFHQTGYSVYEKLVKKIESIEASQLKGHETQYSFIREKKAYLDTISNYTPYEFDKLNDGLQVEAIEQERSFLNKYR